jgi:hypothetical protein
VTLSESLRQIFLPLKFLRFHIIFFSLVCAHLSHDFVFLVDIVFLVGGLSLSRLDCGTDRIDTPPLAVLLLGELLVTSTVFISQLCLAKHRRSHHARVFRGDSLARTFQIPFLPSYRGQQLNAKLDLSRAISWLRAQHFGVRWSGLRTGLISS